MPKARLKMVFLLGSTLGLIAAGCETDPSFSDPDDDPDTVTAEAHKAEATAVAQFAAVFDGGIPSDGGSVLTATQLQAAVDQEETDARAGHSSIVVQSVPLRGLPSFSTEHRQACMDAQGTKCAPDFVKTNGGFNLNYGFHCGAGWGGGITRAYDALDACCFYHDSNCWNINRKTGVDETGGGCSQTVNFIRCVEAVVPTSTETEQARIFILNSLLRIGADICELRPWWAFWPRGSFYPLYDPKTAPSPRCQGGHTLLTP